MSITEAKKKKEIDDDKIDIKLSDIIQFLKDSRRWMIMGAIAGLAIGAIYAFSKPNIYKVQITVMPEIQSKGSGSLGSLGSLAGLAGISLGNIDGSDAIYPELYPNVFESIPFALYLLKQSVYSQKLQAKMSLQEFIERIDDNNFAQLFGVDKEVRKDEKVNLKRISDAIQITEKQDILIKVVQASASGIYDKKTGMLTIIAIEPDPLVAATVAQLSLNYLTNFITTYRTEKVYKQVIFLTKRVSEAKSRYQSAEYALSNYRDRNRSLFLNTAKIDEQRLQADYLLEQSVYNDLSKQLEMAKIKVQAETPVFKMLDPPTVPLRKSGPKRTLIMLGFSVAGIFITLIVLIMRRILNSHSVQTV